MKYWRGYLVAAILAAITLGLREIAETHTKLVDMIYPYVTRMVQNFMSGWSGAVDFCVWQVLLLVMVVLGLATVVLLVIFRWNPIQWFGWIVAAATVVMLLHTGIFGLNEFAGPLYEDIRLNIAEGSQEQLESAANYYRDKANALSTLVKMSSEPSVKKLSEQADNGFKHLVYDEYYAVFAGSTAPVKELGMAEFFTSQGQMGYTAAVTGEAAVNMEAPTVMLPFAVCREMCYRMCIASERDKHFGAFLACQANEDLAFQYAGYVMAYRYCLNALPQNVASTVAAKANAQVTKDVEAWNEFVKVKDPIEFDPDELINKLAQKESHKKTPAETELEIVQLLVSWHYEKIVLPSIVEPEVEFDPYDETMVDLTGLPYGPEPTEPAATEESTEEAA